MRPVLVPCDMQVRLYTSTEFLAKPLAFGLRGFALCFFPTSSPLGGGGCNIRGLRINRPLFGPSRFNCGVFSASGSTFICSPSDAVIGLGTLLIAGDLSGVLLIDAEGHSGGKGDKGNVRGGGGGEDSGDGGGGGSGGKSGGGGRITNIRTT